MLSPPGHDAPGHSTSAASTVTIRTETSLDDIHDQLSGLELLLHWLRLSWAINKAPNAIFIAVRDLLRLLTLGFVFLFVVTAVLLFMVPDWHAVLHENESNSTIGDSGAGSILDESILDEEWATARHRNVVFKYAAVVAVCASFIGIIVSMINLGALAAIKQNRVRSYLDSITCFIIPVPLLFVVSVIATTCAIGFHPVMSANGDGTFAYVTMGILVVLFLASILLPLCIGRANFGHQDDDNFSSIGGPGQRSTKRNSDTKKGILKRQSWGVDNSDPDSEPRESKMSLIEQRESRVSFGLEDFYRHSLRDMMQDIDDYRLSDDAAAASKTEGTIPQYILERIACIFSI